MTTNNTTDMETAPHFIADVMLGSLAKWLRILGFDTLYFRSIDDNELIRIAKQQDRILLTRDGGICGSRKAGKCLLVESEIAIEQIRQVLKSVGTEVSRTAPMSICTTCNGRLSVVPKESVSGEVPDYVFRKTSAFFRCVDCGKVYWEGSHKRLISAVIEHIAGDTEAS